MYTPKYYLRRDSVPDPEPDPEPNRDTNRTHGTEVPRDTAKYNESTAEQRKHGTRIGLSYVITYTYLPIRRQM